VSSSIIDVILKRRGSRHELFFNKLAYYFEYEVPTFYLGTYNLLIVPSIFGIGGSGRKLDLLQ